MSDENCCAGCSLGNSDGSSEKTVASQVRHEKKLPSDTDSMSHIIGLFNDGILISWFTKQCLHNWVGFHPQPIPYTTYRGPFSHCKKVDLGVNPKTGGFSPKMDGENNGRPY